jgi:hypothetical protein
MFEDTEENKSQKTIHRKQKVTEDTNIYILWGLGAEYVF